VYIDNQQDAGTAGAPKSPRRGEKKAAGRTDRL